MKVRLNEDRQVVDAIREGLKRTGGYCPCRLARTGGKPLHVQGIQRSDRGPRL